ncbi:MAG: hypothetical protein OQK51_04190, partial [Kangiellaceae bacterium]|nr:hypothetical protein [Kangiellaceae bacterium]
MNFATSDKQTVYELNQLDWKLCKLPAGEYAFSELESQAYETTPAKVPGTVPMTVKNEEPDCLQPQLDYHDFNWVYKTRIDSSILASITSPKLVFEGLATLCDVWLNGEHALSTDNMFRRYEFDLSSHRHASIELVLVFRSVNDFLQQRRPRPRWKTKLVDNQQMRWIRATVLGHVDVWTPPIKTVGPWRPIKIEGQYQFKTERLILSPMVVNEVPVLNLDLSIKELSLEQRDKVCLIIDGTTHELDQQQQATSSSIEIQQSINLPGLKLWQPHTHGTPHQYQYQLLIIAGENTYLVKQGT